MHSGYITFSAGIATVTHLRGLNGIGDLWTGQTRNFNYTNCLIANLPSWEMSVCVGGGGGGGGGRGCGGGVMAIFLGQSWGGGKGDGKLL